MWGTLVWWRSIGRFDWPTHDVWTGLVHIGCVRCKTTYLTCFGTMPKKTEHAWGSFFFCGVCICSRVYNIPDLALEATETMLWTQGVWTSNTHEDKQNSHVTTCLDTHDLRRWSCFDGRGLAALAAKREKLELEIEMFGANFLGVLIEIDHW